MSFSNVMVYVDPQQQEEDIFVSRRLLPRGSAGP